MSATIRIGNKLATCTDYEWTTDDPDLFVKLDNLLDPRGPSGSDPNPDFNAALDAIAFFGGDLVSYDKTEYDANVIY